MGAYISRLMGAYTREQVGAAATAIITILVEYFLVKWIRRNQTIFYQIEEAKQVGYSFMKLHTKIGITRSYSYAYVEGVVSADDKKEKKIVVLQKPLTLKEMLWPLLLHGVTGRELDTGSVAEHFETVSSHLLVKENHGDEPMKVFITDPSKATFVMPGLSILIRNGRRESLLSLVVPAKTTLIGFGKVTVADNDKVTIEPPANSEGCYILSGVTREELLRTFQNKIGLLEVIAFAIFLIGGGITIYMIYSYRRRQRLNAQHVTGGTDVTDGTDVTGSTAVTSSVTGGVTDGTVVTGGTSITGPVTSGFTGGAVVTGGNDFTGGTDFAAQE